MNNVIRTAKIKQDSECRNKWKTNNVFLTKSVFGYHLIKRFLYLRTIIFPLYDIMKRFLLILATLFLTSSAGWSINDVIRISTSKTDLVLRVDNDGRLYQSYLGERLPNDENLNFLPQGKEVYITHGMEDYFEPAIEIHHNDGTSSLLLKYVSHETKQLSSEDEQETIIIMHDEVYPIRVELHYTTYYKENIIRTRTVICNEGKKAIQLARYASSMLHFDEYQYYLTEFSGDWAREASMTTAPLTFGKKILDTKLGARANMFTPPMFILSLGEEANENSGKALLGTLGWTGNFRFTFEVDQNGCLRVISGINPYYSQYELSGKCSFETPDFFFTLTTDGLGSASRDFHDWARTWQLNMGDKERFTLLNNWEATFFGFDEDKLCHLMDNAATLGVDLFLLDDGWFGNKYPRSSDNQGLGDWEETKEKLPGKITRLCEEAKEKNIRFGIWIEPEMVNPKSELYEKHPDWVIHQPNRDEYYFRNQLVLDLSNPAVQDFVFGVVDRLMTAYPEIAFFKWDCNSPITNIYSPYLKDKQQHLYVDYVHGLYTILDRIKAKYPQLRMMLCSGGSGRIDYKALSYFSEFWASDNTDPVERLFIQYGYSFFYPAKATCAHVTSWNSKASVKFRTDVAMMGKLGFDIRIDEMNADELAYCQQAVKEYKRLSHVILDGDQYRLISPYSGEHSSTMYVDKEKAHAVVFAYDIAPRMGEKRLPVKLSGLSSNTMYHVKEINMMPGHQASIKEDGQSFSGDYLMKVGLNILSGGNLQSRIIELSPAM